MLGFAFSNLNWILFNVKNLKSSSAKAREMKKMLAKSNVYEEFALSCISFSKKTIAFRVAMIEGRKSCM
jgi:hypothetical protein